MVQLAAFPKCYLDDIIVHKSMSLFDWIEKAYDERHPWLISINVDLWTDPLRSDPRFTDLLRRIGLEP